jgi:hypothetical protein
MSISFSELLILLIPGLFGSWVYKRISTENLDNRGEIVQAGLAMLFGIFSLCIVSIIGFIPSEAFFGGSGATILLEKSFWPYYATLFLASGFLGYWCGILQARERTPVDLLGKSAAKWLKRPTKTSCETAMRAMVNTLCGEASHPMTMIYTIGNRNAGIVGFWEGYSETEKEIQLSDIHLCVDWDLHDREKYFDNEPRKCCVNYALGTVVELVARDNEFHNKVKERLIQKYNEKQNRLSRQGTQAE